MVLALLLVASLFCIDANEPFDPTEHENEGEIKHKFYDVFYYAPGSAAAAALDFDNIKLSELDDSNLHEQLSDTDDGMLYLITK